MREVRHRGGSKEPPPHHCCGTWPSHLHLYSTCLNGTLRLATPGFSTLFNSVYFLNCEHKTTALDQPDIYVRMCSNKIQRVKIASDNKII